MLRGDVMLWTASGLNLALGVAYMAIGAMVLVDLRRQQGTFGSSLGYALVAMAYTCGPHHFEHGLHIALGDDRLAGPLDIATVAIGLPAAVVFAYLAAEGFRGGEGDRTIAGTPRWLATLGFTGVGYLTVFAALVVERTPEFGAWNQVLLPNMLLVVIYAAIGVVILQTQVARRPLIGGWSLSGLSLGLIFPTCAAMHATWVMYGALGSYTLDRHLLVIDWMCVPAGLYFLWVVRRLRGEALDAWDVEPSPSAA